jgi:organic hydroperoxide reductase OsmC/OhrA
MSEHRAHISWHRETDSFAYDDYSRAHVWTFPGGSSVKASSAPDYLGEAEHVDPEEALVGAISSCHMLTFLAIASKKRFVVDRYDDPAVGVMEPNEDDKLAVTRVVLRPKIAFSGERQPTESDIAKMHHQSHEHCFIANSVRTRIEIEPQ